MILMLNAPEMSLPWFEQLEQGVRTGQVPLESVYGQPLYTDMDRHADFNGPFAQAMDSVEALAGDHFATEPGKYASK